MTPHAPIKTLVFISSKKQLDYFIANRMIELYGDAHIVCLNPMAEYHAGKIGLNYTSAESLYQPAQLMRFASEGYKSCEEFAEYLDREINAGFNNVCTAGYFSSPLFIFRLKTFLDSGTSKLHVLLAAIKAFLPARVICFIDDASFPYFEQDIYLGDFNYKMLDFLKDKFNYELIGHRLPVPEANIQQGYPQISVFARLLLKTWMTLKQWKRATDYITHRNPSFGTVALGKNNTLAVLGDYTCGWQEIGGKVVNLADIITCIKFTSQDIESSKLLVKFGLTNAALENFWQELSSKAEFIKWFEYRGINFSTVTSHWLKQFVCATLPECVLAVEVVENKLKEYKASAFLTPAFCHRNEIAAVLACKRLGVKVCSVQHGSEALLELPMLEYIEFQKIDYAFVYGPGAVNHARKTYHLESKKDVAEPVVVGNPYLYKLLKKKQKNPRLSPGKQLRILYILTHLIPDFLYYGWNCYPNGWYSQFQRRVLDTIKSFPEVTLYIKQYQALPVEDPLRDYAANINMGNVVFVENTKDMEKYLDKADLFLIDFPSTSLLKMLCTRKPIIVYCNPEYLKMSPDVEQLLKKRVDLYFTIDELLSMIEKFCRLPSWPELENPDDSFFTYYNLGKQGMEPKRQVVEFLLSCLRHQETSSR